MDPAEHHAGSRLGRRVKTGLLLTTEAVISDEPEPKEAAGGGGDGGMGGMM